MFRDEYDLLFASMFHNAHAVKRIVELLYTRNAGFSRKEICDRLDIESGGTLTDDLNALILSDFVVRYVPFGMSKREEHYKLTDPFCLFFLHCVRNQSLLDTHFWTDHLDMPSGMRWKELAFENVCFNHIHQIKQALGIIGVRSTQSAWPDGEDDPERAQIDLLINRNDHVINECEIRFCSEAVTVDKAYYLKLMHRQNILIKDIPRRSTIFQTLITTYGVSPNEYSHIFSSVVTLEDLFMEIKRAMA
ncbi:MAG: hypothetical protein IJT77_14310 [Clostridia bacterium]|nr:hypothetical protein [Clostridia bacterium]